MGAMIAKHRYPARRAAKRTKKIKGRRPTYRH